MLQDKLKPWEINHLTKEFATKRKNRKFLRKMGKEFSHPHSVFSHHATYPWSRWGCWFFEDRKTFERALNKEKHQNLMHLYRLGRFAEDEIVDESFDEDVINGEAQNFDEMLEFYLPVSNESPLLADFELKCNEA